MRYMAVKGPFCKWQLQRAAWPNRRTPLRMLRIALDQTSPSLSLSVRLEDIASIVAVTASAAFVASLMYDIGFVTALHTTISEIPTTLADHTLSALLWLPSVVVGGVLGIAGGHATVSVARGVVRRSGLPAAMAGPLIHLAALFASLLLGWWLLGNAVWFTVLVIISGVWVAQTLRPQRENEERSRYLALIAARCAIPAALAIATLGYVSGAMVVSNPQQTAVIRVGGGSPQTVPVLRHFERGLLYNDRGYAAFAAWDSVQLLRSRNMINSQMRLGYLCRFYACGGYAQVLAPPTPSDGGASEVAPTLTPKN